jgi:hypothetical protein
MDTTGRKDSKEELVGGGKPAQPIALELEVSQDVDEATQVELEQEKNSRIRCIAMVLLMGAVVIVLYLIFGKRAITWLHKKITTIASENSFRNIFILLLVQVPFGCIPFLPGLAYVNVMQAIIFKSMIKSWLIFFCGGYLVSMGVFVIVRTFFIDDVRNRFKHFEPYQMLLEETKEHPVRDGILFNFMFIPANVKNYLIAITNLKLHEAAIVHVPGSAVLCFLSAMIGTEINDVSELFKSKSFSEKTSAEKIQLVATIILMIFTAIFIISLGIHYKNRYKRFQQERRDRQAMDGVRVGVTEIIPPVQAEYDRI